MLGAQALRTKQKAEQKEKEKRHRERLRSIEIQRDKLHKAACDDASERYMEMSAQSSMKPSTNKHRHSMQVNSDNQLQIHRPHSEKVDGAPQRSASPNGCRDERKQSGNIPSSSSSKFLKWLGIGEKEKKDLKKRRMSTFT
ncbi:hypothetical protein KIN20_036294 [Parelaphostrongylus tenuis]|uniref:Uncharacterized protein n=1 Tax=Parelaphostrongylus tenuis TaxID=148309 RepID=A0AAD5RCF5_PARTN|nr:hypothetical protein KIN20_036294 [Parelaphostrongylus tenuis]